MMLPSLLSANNFTPPSRTPWGGHKLASDFKAAYLSEGERRARVGEAWEISVEPDFPAYLADGTSLAAYIARDPEAALGAEHRRGRTGTALLVKLLDTAEPLSVQIHPDDHYAGLAPDECGKPESWYVVEAAAGAGLYLGFREGVSESEVRQALSTQASLEPLLRFVPVTAGDFFVIDAGTPHAIGGGLTLVEPQHVLPGKRGVTYRYWDWNRRYDAQGRLDPNGQPRALHAEHALTVTAWQQVTMDGFIDRIRLRAGEALAGEARTRVLCGPKGAAQGGGLHSAFLQVAQLQGTGRARLPFADRLRGITVLAGTVEVGGVVVPRGRSAVVPACAGEADMSLVSAHALVTAVV